MTSSANGTRYTIERKLASGGMADLYEGRAVFVTGAEKRVAFKRILPQYARDERWVDMLLDEARVAINLQHPNIVQTYDIVADGEAWLLVMELLEGADLSSLSRSLVRAQRWYTLSQVMHVGMGLLAGLHYAHERAGPDGQPLELVHRDVSPQNVFITTEGHVRLLDFGIAKSAAARGHTESGVVKGKIRYMSPEQSVGAPLDRRTDVFAAGVVLYELLTAQRVRPGLQGTAALRAVVEAPLAPPSRVSPRCPEDLDPLIMRALQMRRSDRFPTAAAFQEALEQYCRAKSLLPSSLELSRLVVEVREAPAAADAPTRVHLDASGGSPRATPAEGSAFTTVRATVRRVGSVVLLQLRGPLNEQFEGAALAPHLRGAVVVDLGELGRITSFGVRAWLELLAMVRGQVLELYFVRCPEAWLHQASMMRGLLGDGRIVSYFAPYRCSVGGHGLAALLHGREGLEALLAGAAPAFRCAAHDCAAVFDEDPDHYFAFQHAYEPSPPAAILDAIGAIAPEVDRPLELVVDGTQTRLVVRCPIDGSALWARALAVVEGSLILDITEPVEATAGGLERLLAACRRDGVGPVVVEGAPWPLVRAVRADPTLRGRVTVHSVGVRARCEPCAADRLVRLDLSAASRLVGGMALPAHRCRRCDAPLLVASEASPASPASGGCLPAVLRALWQPGRRS